MSKETEEAVIVTVTGPDGTEQDYVEDVQIPWMGKQFAVLVSIPEEGSEEEPEIILSRVEQDEEGEPVYLPPTEEEYEAVASIYAAM